MKFSEEFIERVRSATNIVDIIGRHTELRRAGRNLFGLCPYPDHKEKTGSFSVDDGKQAYFCFGCKRGGNVYTFLQAIEGMSFPEAVEFLANRAHIPLPANQERDANNDPMQEYRRITLLAAQFYKKQFESLPDTHPVRMYALQRGLNAATMEQFLIGYASDEWSALADFLQQKKVNLQWAEKLGLVRARSGGKNGYYDLFRARLMFPIVSPNDSVLGFGGRIIGQGEPKYLNSPETPLFHKSRVFYGLKDTAKHIRTQDCAIVVEGYMDFLALYQAGIQNAVAVLGTAMTEYHAQILRRFSKNVIVMFDGDGAGQRAAMHSLPILLEQGLFAKGLTLPDELDPDEFLKERGVDALSAAIRSEAKDLFFIFLEREMSEYKATPSEKVQLMDKVGPMLEKVADSRLRDIYLQETAVRMGVQPGWLRQQLQNTKSKASSQFAGANLQANAVPKAEQNLVEKEILVQIDTKGISKEESILLSLATHREEYLKELLDQNVGEYFANLAARQIFQIISDEYGQNPSVFDKLTASVSSKVIDPSVVTKHLDSELFASEEEEKKLLKLCMTRIKDRYLKQRAQTLTRDLKAGTENPEKLAELMAVVKNRHSLRND